MAALVAGVETAASAGTIRGLVYLDHDEDGLPGTWDEALAGVEVFWGWRRSATTDAQGRFELTVPDREGILWVRSPDSAVPGSYWAQVGPDGAELDFGLTPAPTTPFSFAVGSDTHFGADGVSAQSVITAVNRLRDSGSGGVPPAPHFVVLTGDVTTSSEPAQFEPFVPLTRSRHAPLIPVPGNHDWYDGGKAYGAAFGPSCYSFDAGGVHFVVLNDMSAASENVEFLDRDLATVPDQRMVVAFMHAPPEPELVDELELRGVDYLFTGHLHANRVLAHDSLLEFNTQPLAMGGIDMSPAGYRLVSLGEDGSSLVQTSLMTVDQSELQLSYPRATAPRPDCDTEILATAYGPGRALRTRATTNYGRVELEHVGGWTFRGRAPDECRKGIEPVLVETWGIGWGRGNTFAMCLGLGSQALGAVAYELGDWPALGGAQHTGYGAHEIAPPLQSLWATSVGAHIAGGALAVADGRVFVPLTDFGAGAQGGVAALDARTGATLWRVHTGADVRSAPVVRGDTVVFGSLDGTVHAVSAATGDALWSYELGAGLSPQFTSLYASPVVDGEVVYAGIQRELAALDLESGAPRWSAVPRADKGFYGTAASPALAGDLLVSSFAGGGLGLQAYDRQSGELRWSSPPETTGQIMASPVVGEGRVFVVNGRTELSAIELATGEVAWATQLVPGTDEWSYGAVATPALAGDLLFVPTQSGTLFAVDTRSGLVRWSFDAFDDSILRTAHYRAEVSSLIAAPVVTGDVLWIGGADGALVALDPDTGWEIWRDELAVPVSAGLAAAGDVLFVPTFGGIVHAMRAGEPAVAAEELARLGCPVPAAAQPPPRLGCSTGGGSSRAATWLIGLLLLCRRRRAPERRGQRRSCLP